MIEPVSAMPLIAPASSKLRGEAVRLVEVGPRDGLQNEARYPDTAARVELITRLAACGLPAIEVGAFVSPRRVPAMADTADVIRNLPPFPGVSLPVLVPNQQGLEQALLAGCTEIAVFVSASEGFS